MAVKNTAWLDKDDPEAIDGGVLARQGGME